MVIIFWLSIIDHIVLSLNSIIHLIILNKYKYLSLNVLDLNDHFYNSLNGLYRLKEQYRENII